VNKLRGIVTSVLTQSTVIVTINPGPGNAVLPGSKLNKQLQNCTPQAHTVAAYLRLRYCCITKDRVNAIQMEKQNTSTTFY